MQSLMTVTTANLPPRDGSSGRCKAGKDPRLAVRRDRASVRHRRARQGRVQEERVRVARRGRRREHYILVCSRYTGIMDGEHDNVETLEQSLQRDLERLLLELTSPSS